MSTKTVNHLEKSQACRISEIFYSLQGESRTTGIPTVFVRLTGCPLRCGYCDTAYAFQGGEMQSIPAILDTVAQYNTRFVTVTGGEPLAQPSCLTLLKSLCDQGYQVSLETSGALSIAEVDTRVIKVMDLKTPSSNEMQRNDYSNLEHITKQDQLKFVIGDKQDYLWSCEQIQQHQLTERCEILFSPVHGELPPAELADWILTDQLAVRMQVQLHKVLWGNEPGR